MNSWKIIIIIIIKTCYYKHYINCGFGTLELEKRKKSSLSLIESSKSDMVCQFLTPKMGSRNGLYKMASVRMFVSEVVIKPPCLEVEKL